MAMLPPAPSSIHAAAVSYSTRATIIDISDTPFAAAIAAEHVALIDALPDRDRVLTWTVADKSTLIEDVVLTERSRPPLRDRLGRIATKGHNVDIADAISYVVDTLPRVDRRARLIVLFCTGKLRAPDGSPFHGRSLASVLEDRGIVPDDVQLIVRLFGEADPLVVSRRNIVVLRTPTNWQARLHLPPRAPLLMLPRADGTPAPCLMDGAGLTPAKASFANMMRKAPAFWRVAKR